jgi:superkiller protein 3
LLNDDFELAREAFTRGQSMSPEYPGPWLGQGLLASLTGNVVEMRRLFQHALEISDASWLSARRQYAVNTFDTIVSGKHIGYLNEPILALQQILRLTADQSEIEHLSGLLFERTGSYEEAAQDLRKICSVLEEQYEVSESAEDLTKFVSAKADLARVELALGNYEEAIENADFALSLLPDDSDPEEMKTWKGGQKNFAKCRLTARLTSGIGSYHNGNHDNALISLERALKESKTDPDVLCLVAQVLWAKGGSKARESARNHLFDCIEKHPNHVRAVSLLGAIGILDNDSDVLEAVLEELRALAMTDPASSSEFLVANLLPIIAALSASSEDAANEAAVSEAAVGVFLNPQDSRAWLQLATLSGGEQGPAEMALATSMQTMSIMRPGGCEQLASALAGVGRIAEDQRAIMVAPWLDVGWKALQGDLEQQASG